MKVKNYDFKDIDDFNLGAYIASKLFQNNTKVMLLFIDGLQTNGSDVLDGIASINNTIPVAGGMAGFPFGKKRFSKIIQENHNEPMAD